MKIVIQTQHRENYGAHDWDGEGECPQRWKFKGGDTYILTGVTVEQAINGFFNDILSVAIEDHNDYYDEYIIGSELVDNCVPDTDFHEDWETPIYLTYRDGEFHARRGCRPEVSFRKPVVLQRESWIQRDGDRADFLLEYRLESGEWVSFREWNERVKKEKAA